MAFRSCAHWLAYRTGHGLHTAREMVRVSRALPKLPLVSEAMGKGELLLFEGQSDYAGRNTGE